MAKIEEMRQSHDAYRDYKHRMEREDCEVWERPIRQWGDCTYVVVGTIDLKPGMQRLEVIDITDMPKAARFSRRWPDQGERNWALVIVPSEGHTAILWEDGRDCWVRFADLAIRVEPGTKADMRQVREQQMDELENAEHVEWY